MIRTQLARIKRKSKLAVLSLIDNMAQKDYAIRYHHEIAGYHVNSYTFKNNEIAFVHLPKTGGTSFYKILNENINHRFVNLEIHKPVSILCSPKEFQYCTIMRDPINRVWSQYQMVLRKEPNYPYHNFAKKGLKCFLNNCWAVRDMACQYYTGEVYKKADQQMYDKALYNLNHFHTIISFDHFSREVSNFLKENNIPLKEMLHERKATYITPTQEEKELIKTYNSYDIALFKAWKEKRENQ